MYVFVEKWTLWWKVYAFRENQVSIDLKCCHFVWCQLVFLCTKRPLFRSLICSEGFGIWRHRCWGSVKTCLKTRAKPELKSRHVKGWKCWFAHVASWPARLEEESGPSLLHEQMLGRSSLSQSFWLTDPALLPLQIRISYVTRIYLSLKQGSRTALP